MYGMRILWWIVAEGSVFLVNADKLDSAKTNVAVSSHGASVRGNWKTQHKATYSFQCRQDSATQELSEKQIRQRIDQYFAKFGFAAQEDDKGKYSIWDVAGIVPFCRTAICAGEVDHGPSTETVRKVAVHDRATHADNEPGADRHTHGTEDHQRTTAREVEEERKNGDEEGGGEREEGEEGEEEEHTALLQKKEHNSQKRRTEGTTMTAFEAQLSAETLSLCVSHYYTMRCGKQKGGAVMSMQCFLAEDNAIDNQAIDEDIVKQLQMLEESTSRHIHERSHLCKPLEATEQASSDALKETGALNVDERDGEENATPAYKLPCDFSLEYEKLMLKNLRALDRDAGILACERSVLETAKRKKHVWGSPVHIPDWQVPKISCGVPRKAGEYSMAVRLLARKHRLSYMQSWFARMENELFHGEWQWFISHLRNFTTVARNPTSATRNRITELVEYIQEVKKETRRKGARPGAREKGAVLDDELDLLRSLDNEDLQPKTGSDMYSPTHRQNALTSWNYRISALDSYSLGANKQGSGLSSYYDYTQELGSQNLATLGAPEVIGHTRWRDFLQSPHVWRAGFWKLISPANYHRLLAQMEITQDMCKHLGISITEYRPHTHVDHRDAVHGQAVAGSGEETSHFPTDLGVCSLTMIVARLEASKRAHDEAGRILNTEQYAGEQVHVEQAQKDIAKHEADKPHADESFKNEVTHKKEKGEAWRASVSLLLLVLVFA